MYVYIYIYDTYIGLILPMNQNRFESQARVNPDFQYHLSQLTFSDEWYRPPVMHPEDVGSTPGSVTFPPPGFCFDTQIPARRLSRSIHDSVRYSFEQV